MKNSRPGEDWFARLLRWAEDGESGPVQAEEPEPEDPDRAEFMDYLEYLDAHPYVDFTDYRMMRAQAEESRGEGHPSPERGGPVPARARRRYRPGRLRRQIRLYRVLSAAVAGLLMATLVWVAVQLPAFGDPQAPGVNEVSRRYLEQGVEETGAVNAVTGMILDYRAFDTFGESAVLFAASVSVWMLMGRARTARVRERDRDWIFIQVGRLMIPAVLMFGIYVVVNGHLSPGGGFSGGTVLGCALILGSLTLGQGKMDRLLPPRRVTALTAAGLLAYGVMKGYSFFTGANHVGWDIPKGTPGRIFSAGLILPLNVCVGVIVACTMYAFYTLFARKEA